MHINYEALLKLWENDFSIEKGLQREIRVSIVGVATKMKSFYFLWHLQLAIVACSQTYILSKTLQSIRITFIERKALGIQWLNCCV